MAGLKAQLAIALLAAISIAAAGDVVAESGEGSQLPEDQNACAACHGDAARWTGDRLRRDYWLRLFVPREELAEDVHWQRGVNCHDCHGGDPRTLVEDAAHAERVDDPQSGRLPFQMLASDAWKSCVKCHETQRQALAGGVHGRQAATKDGERTVLPLVCRDCHRQAAHGLYPVDDRRSRVFVENQVQLCGECHQQAWDEYRASVHGHGLEHSGLLVSAVCSDCHGGHGIHPASDRDSTLHPANVAATCAKCHLFIEERLQKSVHGRQDRPGGEPQEPAPGGQVKRTASCTDCHEGHDMPDPGSPAFRLRQPERCGSCHEEASDQYAISVHGQLTELGYEPAAKCADCHGAHEIRAIADPGSRVSSMNREETCGTCHVGAVANFLNFDPHADPHDPIRNPALYRVYLGLVSLFITVFVLFGAHSLAWFMRSLMDVYRKGRPPRLLPGTVAYVRFKPAQRAAHAVMMVSFLGLALTGLPLKYSQYQWAHAISYAMGGFASTSLWHRIFGVVNVGCLLFFCVWILVRLFLGPKDGGSRARMVFGADSPLPNRRDLKDFLGALRWFVGCGPKPAFEHWAYWEKFDLWAASGDIIIIGATGLALWFPNLFCAVLPGEALNFAILIHTRQALLATAFVFAIHFFSTHLRPEKFPMDMSILTGLVSEQELREERPEYFSRLQREGKLDSLQTTVPSRNYSRLMFFMGTLALLIGWGLLAGIVVGLWME